MQQLAVAFKKAEFSFFWPRPKEGKLRGENYSSYFWVAKLIKQMAQLTLGQRYRIEFSLLSKMSYSEIGEYIDKDRSVVSREISRNSDARNGKYKAELAHRKAKERHTAKKKKKHFTAEIEAHVREYITQDYSPEQIKGRAVLEDIPCVSHERIYQFIWNDKKIGGKLYEHLRNRGKRYRKRGHNKDNRGLIVGRVDIDQRPDIVEKKERIGDFEIDLIIGKGHKQAILTLNDRATGILVMGKVPSKEAVEIEKKTLELLEEWKPMIHTITSDNGKEFANHINIAEKLDLDFYFAKPYHSWQRGANENLNGLVRQYFPKNYDFTTITNRQIQDVQNILNNRPRKRFGFKSPNEFFAQKLNLDATVAFIT